jgi:hypothetical protein
MPNKGQVLQRSYGWYASRSRGIRRKAGSHKQPSVGAAAAGPPALSDVLRRWAELLRRIFEVNPLRCPRCGEAMPVVAFITQPRLIDGISDPPPPPGAPRPPPSRTTSAPGGWPHCPSGVNRVRPCLRHLWILSSEVFGLHAGWLRAWLGPDPAPARPGSRPFGARSGLPAAQRPAPQAPSPVPSASRTLGEPIEIPIPYSEHSQRWPVPCWSRNAR